MVLEDTEDMVDMVDTEDMELVMDPTTDTITAVPVTPPLKKS